MLWYTIAEPQPSETKLVRAITAFASRWVVTQQPMSRGQYEQFVACRLAVGILPGYPAKAYRTITKHLR